MQSNYKNKDEEKFWFFHSILQHKWLWTMSKYKKQRSHETKEEKKRQSQAFSNHRNQNTFWGNSREIAAKAKYPHKKTTMLSLVTWSTQQHFHQQCYVKLLFSIKKIYCSIPVKLRLSRIHLYRLAFVLNSIYHHHHAYSWFNVSVSMRATYSFACKSFYMNSVNLLFFFPLSSIWLLAPNFDCMCTWKMCWFVIHTQLFKIFFLLFSAADSNFNEN